MKWGLASIVILVLAIGSSPVIAQRAGPAAPAGTQRSDDKAASETADPLLSGAENRLEAEKSSPHGQASYLELANELAGRPAILVHYPWHVHQRASIEVRLLEKKESGETPRAPLGFVAQWMKGDVTNAVYAAREKSATGPTTKTMTLQGREVEIRGSVNALGKAGVCVVLPERPRANEGQLAKYVVAEGTSAVFCLLDSWARDRSTLRLELPAKEFAKAGTLHVWFLRNDTVVWSEKFPWPGAVK